LISFAITKDATLAAFVRRDIQKSTILELWRPLDNKLLWEKKFARFVPKPLVKFSNDGTVLAASDLDQAMTLFYLQSGGESSVEEVVEGVDKFCWSFNGDRLVSRKMVDEASCLRLWTFFGEKAEAEKPPYEFSPAAQSIDKLAFTNDLLAVSYQGENSVAEFLVLNASYDVVFSKQHSRNVILKEGFLSDSVCVLAWFSPHFCSRDLACSCHTKMMTISRFMIWRHQSS